MSTVLEEHQELVAKMLARVPPESALQSNDLEGVVDYIKSGKCKKIFVMVSVADMRGRSSAELTKSSVWCR